jgi:hypothetical protein
VQIDIYRGHAHGAGTIKQRRPVDSDNEHGPCHYNPAAAADVDHTPCPSAGDRIDIA